MELTPSGWRVRSRSRHFPFDYSTNILGLKAAQDAAKEEIQRRAAKAVTPKGKTTLQDVVEAYKAMPKRAGEASEKISIYRLVSVVRKVTGKELGRVPSTAIDAQFWLDYIAFKQGGKIADLSKRAPQNAAINSAMKTAAAIFKKSLLPLYAAKGIHLSPDVGTLQLLPVMKLQRSAVKSDLVEKWKELRKIDEPMWMAVGLARFAGMRRDEIQHMTRAWIEIEGAAVYVRICDRPEEGWLHKTGEYYRAAVLDPDLAKALRDAAMTCGPMPGGDLIVQPKLKRPKGRPYTREKWFKSIPQAWVKPFTGTAKKPLHRMRGLYLDDVAKLTEDAVKAKLAGVKAAAEAAGHTSTKTTEDHYLSNDALR